VKVPSKNSASRSRIDPPLHISILHQTAFSVFSSFNPDITVVDTFPHGFAHELDQVLRWRKGKFVYVCRQRRDDKMDGDYLHSLMSRYDLVLVPHEKNAPGVMIPAGVKTLYTGPVLIRNKSDLWPRDKVLAAFHLPQAKKKVLLNMGGGGQENWEKIIDTIMAPLLERDDVHLILARGSLAPAKVYGKCTVMNDYYPICELYNGFDAIVAGSGYNTVNEALHFRLPGIFIPFEREVDDQFRRARTIEESGLGMCLEYGDIARLPEKLDKLFEPAQYSAVQAGLRKLKIGNNAARAARAILRLGTKRR
jgi:UDP-N-acetylglucosamine--N-acetylmuramyl-(pentapeptide) pyrophosphoryl-undecaprenol N-acetylglucosamine transferase